MNVALVVLDTLRKDAFDEHFDWLPGRRFENTWATSNWTAPVHASMFTGKYASEIGVHSRSNSLDCEDETLAERLSDSGYTTRAFSANPNVSQRFQFDRGFDEFEGSWKVRHFNPEDIFDWGEFIGENREEGPTKYLRALKECVAADVDTISSIKQGFRLKFRPERLGSDISDDGAQSALERVRSTDYGCDEFLFVNLMEAHGPYEPPEEYRTVDEHAKPTAVEAITGEAPNHDGDAVRQAYDDAVLYLSDIYQDIFEELRADFDYVITLSDHGEMLGEHGLWDHQHGVFPELTHVPLVVSGDDLSGSVNEPTSLLDVHRTVLDIAGAEGSSRGRNLLESAAREGGTLTEYHGMTQWLIDELERRPDGEDLVAEYDTVLRGIVLPPEYYGYETQDGWTELGEADQDPKERLSQLVDEFDQREIDEEKHEISDEAMDRLDELGYA